MQMKELGYDCFKIQFPTIHVFAFVEIVSRTTDLFYLLTRSADCWNETNVKGGHQQIQTSSERRHPHYV